MENQPGHPDLSRLPVPNFAGYRLFEAMALAYALNAWRLVEHLRDGTHGPHPIREEKWLHVVQSNCNDNEAGTPMNTGDLLGVILDPVPHRGSRKQLVTGVLAGLGGGVIAYVLFKAFG